MKFADVLREIVSQTDSMSYEAIKEDLREVAVGGESECYLSKETLSAHIDKLREEGFAIEERTLFNEHSGDTEYYVVSWY